MSGTKLRNYCFTYFAEKLEIEEDDDIKYCVFQKEKCPETGKIHFQGYVELTKPMRIKAVQELLGIDKAHLEKRMGTRDQARDYCMKEDTRVEGPWEIGNFGKGGQGKRSDLTKLKLNILNPNNKASDIIINEVENFQQLRFAEGLLKYREPYVGIRNVKWFHGVSGTGKSRKAAEEAGDYDEITFRNGFWIGYRGNKNVIINDIRGDVPLNELLRITDRYKLYINIKGGECAWEAINIWITCNVHPRTLYEKCGERVDQLERRISEIRNFERDGTWDVVGGNTETPTTEVEKLRKLLS